MNLNDFFFFSLVYHFSLPSFVFSYGFRIITRQRIIQIIIMMSLRIIIAVITPVTIKILKINHFVSFLRILDMFIRFFF